MLDFQQKRQMRKVFYSKITFWILLILVILLSKQVYDIYKKKQLSQEGLATISKEYNNLKNRENMLSSEIEKLKTENGIEAEIRGKFDVVKPGEQVVIIINNGSSTPDQVKDNSYSFIDKIWSWFK